MPNSTPLKDSYIVDQATNIGSSAFLPQVSKEGEQPAWAPAATME